MVWIKPRESPCRANLLGLYLCAGDMAEGKTRNRLSFNVRVSPEPMPAGDWQAAERILAALIARAYAFDHPELFGRKMFRSDGGVEMSEAA